MKSKTAESSAIDPGATMVCLEHNMDSYLIEFKSNFTFKGGGQTVDIECGADGCDGSIENCFPIRIPGDDPVFHNKKCLEFVRSEGVPDLECSMGTFASMPSQEKCIESNSILLKILLDQTLVNEQLNKI